MIVNRNELAQGFSEKDLSFKYSNVPQNQLKYVWHIEEHPVVQLVEAVSYKTEGRRFDCR
jgi:hypothetical protein